MKLGRRTARENLKGKDMMKFPEKYSDIFDPAEFFRGEKLEAIKNYMAELEKVDEEWWSYFSILGDLLVACPQLRHEFTVPPRFLEFADEALDRSINISLGLEEADDPQLPTYNTVFNVTYVLIGMAALHPSRVPEPVAASKEYLFSVIETCLYNDADFMGVKHAFGLSFVFPELRDRINTILDNYLESILAQKAGVHFKSPGIQSYIKALLILLRPERRKQCALTKEEIGKMRAELEKDLELVSGNPRKHWGQIAFNSVTLAVMTAEKAELIPQVGTSYSFPKKGSESSPLPTRTTI